MALLNINCVLWSWPGGGSSIFFALEKGKIQIRNISSASLLFAQSANVKVRKKRIADDFALRKA
jgi:ABC-type taurine transport system substrate-binding protein